MDLFVAAVGLLATLSGLLCLAVFGFLQLSRRTPLLARYLAYLGSYTALAALAFLGNALAVLGVPVPDPRLMPWFRLPELALLAVFTLAVPRFFASLAERPLPPRLATLFRALAFATVASAPLSLLPPAMAPLDRLPWLIGLGSFLGSMAWSQVMVIREYPRLRERLQRVGVPAIVAFNLLCLIGGVVDSLRVQEGLQAGAWPHGQFVQALLFVLWNLGTFVWAIRAMRDGFFEPPRAGGPSRERCLRRGLTEREYELVVLLAQGAANKEIAERLAISPHTVRNHLHNVFAKLGVKSRVALLRALWEP